MKLMRRMQWARNHSRLRDEEARGGWREQRAKSTSNTVSGKSDIAELPGPQGLAGLRRPSQPALDIDNESTGQAQSTWCPAECAEECAERYNNMIKLANFIGAQQNARRAECAERLLHRQSTDIAWIQNQQYWCDPAECVEGGMR